MRCACARIPTNSFCITTCSQQGRRSTASRLRSGGTATAWIERSALLSFYMPSFALRTTSHVIPVSNLLSRMTPRQVGPKAYSRLDQRRIGEGLLAGYGDRMKGQI